MPARLAGTLAVSFAQPAWLAALAVAVVPILAAAWGRRRGRRLPLAAVAGECLALAAAALALARPQAAITARAALPYLLFVDRSGSVRGQADPSGRLGLPADAPVERFDFAEGLRRWPAPAEEPPPPGATNIAPVLRMIASRCAEGIAGAVIVTDGRFTDTAWPGPAEAVAAAGPELLIVPLDAPPPDARIVDLTARRTAPGSVEVTVDLASNAPLRRTLTVRRAGRGQPLLVKELVLLGEAPATVRAADRVAPDAAAEYSARLSGDALIVENDSAAALVLPERQKVAVAGADAKTQQLLRALPVPVAFLQPVELPDSSAPLAEFSAVVVVDATGLALSAAQRAALGEYVRGGGGVVLIGTGPHERPADGVDPLNRAMPLVANPFQRRPLALAVLLDASGSMDLTTTAPGRAEQRKFDIAAQAVVALKDHLTPRDALAVITFADRPQIVYDSGEAPADFAALGDALRGVRPNGSTKVVPALRAALGLPAGAGRTPMLLVLSDLQTEEFDAAEWAGRLRRAAARLAVVAIGESASPAPPLETLARLLGDRASYQRRDRLADLARVFAALVRRGRGEAIRRARTALVVEAPLFDSALTALPELGAYILAGKHPDADLLARTGEGDPILACRRAGLGRTVALAVPLADPENATWQDSPDVAGLLASAVRWTLQGANDPRFDAVLARRRGAVHVAVTADRNGAPWNELQLAAAVAAGEIARSAELAQTAPGRYEAAVAVPPQAPVAVDVRDSQGATVWRGSAAALYPAEFRQLGADRDALERLARATGGRVVPPGEVAAALERSRRRGLTELWPWLLAAAIAIMLAEWCLTRITRRR